MESHRDNLRTILEIAAAGQPDKMRKKGIRELDQHFEELVSRPLNQIKHHANTIQSKSCFNAQIVVYGYYICGLRDDGNMGPSKRAHGETGTGWSFTATLRRLFALLIRTSKLLENELRLPNLDGTSQSWGTTELEHLNAICDWLTNSPPLCFQNETQLCLPDVGIKDGRPYVTLTTIKRLRNADKIRPITWSVGFTGNGINRSFVVS